MYFLVFTALFALSVAAPIAFYYKGGRGRKRGRQALALNAVSFCATVLLVSALIFTESAFAAEVAEVSELALAAAFIGAGLVMGLAAIGTGIAVSSAASAAIGAVSENEGIFAKAMIFVAMAEGIAIYGLLIAFMILNRV